MQTSPIFESQIHEKKFLDTKKIIFEGRFYKSPYVEVKKS